MAQHNDVGCAAQDAKRCLQTEPADHGGGPSQGGLEHLAENASHGGAQEVDDSTAATSSSNEASLVALQHVWFGVLSPATPKSETDHSTSSRVASAVKPSSPSSMQDVGCAAQDAKRCLQTGPADHGGGPSQGGLEHLAENASHGGAQEVDDSTAAASSSNEASLVALQHVWFGVLSPATPKSETDHSSSSMMVSTVKPSNPTSNQRPKATREATRGRLKVHLKANRPLRPSVAAASRAMPAAPFFSVFEPEDCMATEELALFHLADDWPGPCTSSSTSSLSTPLRHHVRPTFTNKESAMAAAAKPPHFLPSTPLPMRVQTPRTRPSSVFPDSPAPPTSDRPLCIVCNKELKPVKVSPVQSAPPAKPSPRATDSSKRTAVVRHVPLKVPIPRPWGQWNGLPASKRQPRSTMAYVGDRTTGCKIPPNEEGFVPIGEWIANDLLGTHQGDRRYLHPRGKNTAKVQRYWVPGYIGVRTTYVAGGNKTSAIPWTSDYQGTYDVMLWDMQKATLVLAGTRSTPDEAAALFDIFSLAYHGVQCANTNFRPSPLLRQEYSDVPTKGKPIVMLALQLWWKAEQLNWDACSGTPDEWDAWNNVVHSIAAGRRSAETLDDMVRLLMQAMLWLLRSLRETVIFPSWRGQPLEDYIAAVAKADKLGAKQDHYYPERDSCHTCLRNLKGRATGENNRHGMHTAEALFRVLDWELISMAAVADVAQGGDGFTKAAEEEAELRKEEEECLERLHSEQRRAKRQAAPLETVLTLPKSQTCQRCLLSIADALDMEEGPQGLVDYTPDRIWELAKYIFSLPSRAGPHPSSTKQLYAKPCDSQAADSDDDIVEITAVDETVPEHQSPMQTSITRFFLPVPNGKVVGHATDPIANFPEQHLPLPSQPEVLEANGVASGEKDVQMESTVPVKVPPLPDASAPHESARKKHPFPYQFLAQREMQPRSCKKGNCLDEEALLGPLAKKRKKTGAMQG